MRALEALGIMGGDCFTHTQALKHNHGARTDSPERTDRPRRQSNKLLFKLENGQDANFYAKACDTDFS